MVYWQWYESQAIEIQIHEIPAPGAKFLIYPVEFVKLLYLPTLLGIIYWYLVTQY